MSEHGLVTKVEFDVHRWYAVVEVHYEDGFVDKPVIGVTGPGEGVGLFESYEEWDEVAD